MWRCREVRPRQCRPATTQSSVISKEKCLQCDFVVLCHKHASRAATRQHPARPLLQQPWTSTLRPSLLCSPLSPPPPPSPSLLRSLVRRSSRPQLSIRASLMMRSDWTQCVSCDFVDSCTTSARETRVIV